MSNQRKIAVIGMGYVGLPVAVAFGKHHPVIGFDINEQRISELRDYKDHTLEVEESELREADVHYTDQLEDLRQADFYIVAVPTPIDPSNRPDLSPLLSASKTVGKALSKGDIVVFESTVYPGATEDDCAPILEEHSGLRSGIDFKLGYSPERINPGDKEHTFTKITKVVSGQDEETLNIVADIYSSVVTAGVHRASSIKVAESAKVIENIQRDLNISLMNELATIFHRLDIDTLEVLEAAGSKWNFLPFRPGLVGGHCIGVDPYYLTHKAESIGHHPQVILSGRRINDSMGRYISDQTIKSLLQLGHPIKDQNITVLGITFKEDVPDIRNSRVVDIVQELQELNMNVQVHDPMADPTETYEEYGIRLTKEEDLQKSNAVILAVPHRYYLERGWKYIQTLLHSEKPLVSDIKSKLNKKEVPEGITLWRL